MVANNEAMLEKICDELTEGLALISDNEKNVTIFGSARLRKDNANYQLTYEIAKLLGECGYNIITGGGPGLMEAASHGGYDAGVKTYGINIVLPHEQTCNDYVTHSYLCSIFHVRKYIMVAKTNAVVVCAGGFGTLDELFEVLTLYVTNYMPKMPIILVGREFWQTIYTNVAKTLVDNGLISEHEIDVVQIVDTKEEVAEAINDFYAQ